MTAAARRRRRPRTHVGVLAAGKRRRLGRPRRPAAPGGGRLRRPSDVAGMTDEPLLCLEDVVKHFPITRGVAFKRQVGEVKAVDGVSLTVGHGETLGLVGETGCGKSTLARCITPLYDLTGGKVVFAGKDISGLSRRELNPVRREIQMIFQTRTARSILVAGSGRSSLIRSP